MSPDEQAASSIRYIAPRVVLLDSGLFALIDMMSDGPDYVQILNGEALLYAIPTEAELSARYAENNLPRLEAKNKKLSLSLEDLGL